MRAKVKKARVGSVVKLSIKYEQHCGFLYGAVKQATDAGSIFVVGRRSGGSWFVAKSNYTVVKE